MSLERIGPFPRNRVSHGDSRELICRLPDRSVDVVVTSPPYWGQRASVGAGVEDDPREYVREIRGIFEALLPKMKPDGILWLNVGDAYNTPVNWRVTDHVYSSLGADRLGLDPNNSAYVKPRHGRRAFIDRDEGWLSYGSLLALPYRLVMGMADDGWVFRGEVIWRKRNPMPEGRARRPHRQHEPIYLFGASDRHAFRVSPPVGSVWDISNEQISGVKHYSRFPTELPRRCIEALGRVGEDVLVLDPFSGSGTTGIVARELGCSFVGFEIDEEQVVAANGRLSSQERGEEALKRSTAARTVLEDTSLSR